MTIFTIDIGNTKTKTAIFRDNALTQSDTFTQLSDSDIKKFLKENPDIDKVILSSVNKQEELRIKALLTDFGLKFYTISHTSPLPFIIDYNTPETLGRDRIAAMAGAYSLKGERNFLIIDVGTCITYDLIVENHFVGGNIAPGYQMRLDAMHNYTASLPQIKLTKPENELGLTTGQAILNGAYWGVNNEIRDIISRYKNKYTDLEVIITGGGAKYLEIENDVIFEPMLTSIGLNFLANNLSK